jgi:hypothetical protein
MSLDFYPSLHELLSECYDASLYHPKSDDARDDHVFFLKHFILSRKLDVDILDLLTKILSKFSMTKDFSLLNETRTINEDLSKQIDDKMSDLNMEKYVYHGTIYGRLKEIQKKGLIPGAKPVWKEHLVSRQHCNSSVFFSRTWRGAILWADAAHHCSRWPREGKFRMPVILRIPMAGLNLENDPRTRVSHSYMVQNAVSLHDPHVIVGRQKGFPIWRPLATVLSEES